MHAVPPKWCGCTPYPAIAYQPDSWWVVPARSGEDDGEGSGWVAITEERAREAIERFALIEAGDEAEAPHLLRRWVHDGIETIAEEGEQRFTLTAAALEFLCRRH